MKFTQILIRILISVASFAISSSILLFSIFVILHYAFSSGSEILKSNEIKLILIVVVGGGLCAKYCDELIGRKVGYITLSRITYLGDAVLLRLLRAWTVISVICILSVALYRYFNYSIWIPFVDQLIISAAYALLPPIVALGLIHLFVWIWDARPFNKQGN